jgi:hypothetical protein
MLTPTEKAGEFILTATNQRIKLTEWEEQDVWDSATLPATVQLDTAVEVEFFGGNQGNGGKKTVRDTNVTKPNQLTSYNTLICLRPFMHIENTWGTSAAPLIDVQGILAGGFLAYNKNQKPIVTGSHAYRFASGYGLVAYGLDTDAGSVAPGGSGIAGTAAQSPLLIPFQLIDTDQFDARLTFPGSRSGVSIGGVEASDWVAYTLATDVSIMVAMHGFVKRPATQ